MYTQEPQDSYYLKEGDRTGKDWEDIAVSEYLRLHLLTKESKVAEFIALDGVFFLYYLL